LDYGCGKNDNLLIIQALWQVLLVKISRLIHKSNKNLIGEGRFLFKNWEVILVVENNEQTFLSVIIHIAPRA
jgi:hypothetical protein